MPSDNRTRRKRRTRKDDNPDAAPPSDEEYKPRPDEHEDAVEDVEEKGSYMDRAAPDEDDEEEDFEDRKDREDHLESTLDKAVRAIEKLHKHNAQLQKEIAKLQARVAKDDVIPEDADSEGDAEYNPNDETQRPSGGSDTDPGDDNPAPEGATKPAPDTTSVPSDKIPKMQKSLEKLIEKRVREEVEARTPTPFMYNDSPEAKLARTDLIGFIKKAIEVDRANSGGTYNTTEGRFGWKTGEGDDNARSKTGLWLRKALQ